MVVSVRLEQIVGWCWVKVCARGVWLARARDAYPHGHAHKRCADGVSGAPPTRRHKSQNERRKEQARERKRETCTRKERQRHRESQRETCRERERVGVTERGRAREMCTCRDRERERERGTRIEGERKMCKERAVQEQKGGGLC